MIAADAWRTVPRTSDRALSAQRVAELYQSDRHRVLAFVRSRVSDPELAEDFMQEAYIRLLRQATDSAMPEQPIAWLMRVAGNLVISHGRHLATVRRAAIPAIDEDPAVSTERLALDRERSDVLATRLAELPADERRALVMAASGYSGREIASAIGRTELATRAMMCRLRSRLRQDLSEAS